MYIGVNVIKWGLLTYTVLAAIELTAITQRISSSVDQTPWVIPAKSLDIIHKAGIQKTQQKSFLMVFFKYE